MTVTNDDHRLTLAALPSPIIAIGGVVSPFPLCGRPTQNNRECPGSRWGTVASFSLAATFTAPLRSWKSQMWKCGGALAASPDAVPQALFGCGYTRWQAAELCVYLEENEVLTAILFEKCH